MKNVSRRFVCAALAACALWSTPGQAGYDAGNYRATKGAGKIVFTSNRDGNWEIYVMRADGSGLSRLTRSREYDTAPQLSPDGRRVLWVADVGGGDETGSMGRICVTNLDGSRKRFLTPRGQREGDARFSFDGKKIVFADGMDSGEPGKIWTMNADGTRRRALTKGGQQNAFPAWSPDGRKIVFESMRSGKYEIYIMDADGKNQKRLTRHENWAGIPAFSPDGKTIAFSSFKNHKTESAIWLMNADGSRQRKITRGDFDDRFCGFSPDGKQLVFRSRRNQNYDIYTMNLNGKNVRRLTTHKAFDSEPDWK